METTIIGKVLPDGRVAHIKLDDGAPLRQTARTLLRFYTRESRLDALLELGNLEYLGPSPYGHYSGSEDEIHCLSSVRDLMYSDSQHKPEPIESKALFTAVKHPALLWEDGRWFRVADQAFVPLIAHTDIPQPKRRSDFSHLSIIKISEHRDRCGGNDEIKGFGFDSWAEMETKAFENNDTYFIFSDNRLIATINPKPAI